MSKRVTRLRFIKSADEPGWGEAQAETLAIVLPYFTACTDLELCGHEFGAGAKSLGAAVCQMPSLELLVYMASDNDSDEFFDGLASKLSLASKLQSVFYQSPGVWVSKGLRTTWRKCGKDENNIRDYNTHHSYSVTPSSANKVRSYRNASNMPELPLSVWT